MDLFFFDDMVHDTVNIFKVTLHNNKTSVIYQNNGGDREPWER